MDSDEKYIAMHKTASWRVKITIGDKQITKCFGFRKHGGIQAALKVAVEYRNKILEENNLLDKIEKTTTFRTATKNEKIIIIGVRFIYNKYNKKGGTFYWVATFSYQDKKRKKHYSIEKYGYEQAFLKACKTRYKHCGTLIVYNMDLLPCEPNVPYIVKDKTNETRSLHTERKSDND